MFYSRPDIPPLGLDLTDLGGGGSCPAQFEGQTAGGRRVHIRYRGGGFSVSVGEDGAPQTAPMETPIDSQIGPALHGDMLLEQACDLAGLTIRGQTPILSEERRLIAAEEADIIDFSGRTTYWIRDLLVTRAGGEHFAEMLAARFPELQIFEMIWVGSSRRCVQRASLQKCERSAIFGFGVGKEASEAIISLPHVPLRNFQMAFEHVVWFTFFHNESFQPPTPIAARSTIRLDCRVSQAIGRNVIFAGSLGGRLRTEFATADLQARKFVQDFIAVVDSCFSNKLSRVDLVSREIIGEVDAHFWYSNDLVAWCNSERFLSAYREDQSPSWIGLRPVIR
jgi:hypothetical protein